MTRTLIIAFLATVATTLVLANDLNLGGPVPGDHSVKNATVIRKPKPYSRRVVIGLGDGSNITSIRAVDHNITNNASVSVLAGGLGRPVVILYLRAPRHRGLNVTVEVRGVRPPKPTPPPPPPTRPPPPPSPTTEATSPTETTDEVEEEVAEEQEEEVAEEQEEEIVEEQEEEAAEKQEEEVAEEQEEEVAEEQEEESRFLNRVYFANKFL